MTIGAGRVAVVTGAGNGIGEASAELLVAAGWPVVLTGHRSELLDRVATRIDPSG